MALPLAPIAVTALRIGTVAAVTYYVARRTRGLPTVHEEAAHDDIDEGVSVRHHRGQDGSQANADARMKRSIRLGRNGPGLEIDLTALGRIRIKRI